MDSPYSQHSGASTSKHPQPIQLPIKNQRPVCDQCRGLQVRVTHYISTHYDCSPHRFNAFQIREARVVKTVWVVGSNALGQGCLSLNPRLIIRKSSAHHGNLPQSHSHNDGPGTHLDGV
jgi:hypothetical protein